MCQDIKSIKDKAATISVLKCSKGVLTLTGSGAGTLLYPLLHFFFFQEEEARCHRECRRSGEQCPRASGVSDILTLLRDMTAIRQFFDIRDCLAFEEPLGVP